MLRSEASDFLMLEALAAELRDSAELLFTRLMGKYLTTSIFQQCRFTACKFKT